MALFANGNPGGGRPLNSRNRLARAFVDDLYAHWQKHGPEAIDRVYRRDPTGYLRTIASVYPKEMVLEVVRTGMHPEERAELLSLLRQELLARPKETPILIEAKVINDHETGCQEAERITERPTQTTDRGSGG